MLLIPSLVDISALQQTLQVRLVVLHKQLCSEHMHTGHSESIVSERSATLETHSTRTCFVLLQS